MVFFLISAIFNVVQQPVHGLINDEEKLAKMIKEKNEQEDWNNYLEALEYNRLSPYERQFLEITNNHYGTNYT